MSANDSTAPTERYGLLTVISKETVRRKTWCVCLCDCGSVKRMRLDSIKGRQRPSCGCMQGPVKHGNTRGYTITPAYRSWRQMQTRCGNPNWHGFRHYGGRGIKVCERWLGADGFANFLADMGEPPAGMTLDRVDSDKDYEPGNCRWADRATQSRNRRRKRTKP